MKKRETGTVRTIVPQLLLFFSIAALIVLLIVAKCGVKLPSRTLVFKNSGSGGSPVYVKINKNLEKRWFDDDKRLMGAQFDGYIFNNMKYTSVQDWQVTIDLPPGCKLDPNPWNGVYKLEYNKLTVTQPHEGDLLTAGFKVADYLVMPMAQKTFGCIMYAPASFEPEKATVCLTYTPFVYPMLIPGYKCAVGFCFTLFVVMFTYCIVSLMRAKEMAVQERNNKEFVEHTLRLFANTIEAKDKYTKGHSERVSIYAREIAARMKLSKKDQEIVYYAAILHDVGKIGVPDAILMKPGRLDDSERAVMQTHSVIGAQILKDFKYIPDVANIVRHHHERFDGTGYPDGLKGRDIPLYSRIICVADCFDAMTSDRCYRSKLDMEQVKQELRNCAGRQFDPIISPVMIWMIEDGAAPVEKY